MFTDLITQAGLKPRHLQKFFKCSRIAASSWVNGHSQPHALLGKRVEVFSTAIQRAIGEGKLPVPEGLPFTESNTYVNDVIRTYVRAVLEESKK